LPLVSATAGDKKGGFRSLVRYSQERRSGEGREEEHMNAWRWFGASLFVVVLGLAVSVHGQEKKGKQDDKGKGKDDKSQVDKGKGKEPDKGKEQPATGLPKLVWKAFDGTTPFYQEMSTSTEQVMKVMQMEVKQKQAQTFWVEWLPQKKEGDDWVVKQTIKGVKMDIEIGGNKISYDSTAKEPPPANPLTDFFKNLVGAEFTLKINSKTLTVTKIEGQDKFIGDLSKTNPQLAPLLKAILSEKALQQMADPVFAAIPPGGDIPASKTWEKESKLDMGPIGTYTTKYKYTYEKQVGNNVEIGVTTALEYSPPGAKTATEGLPFRIAGGKLTSKKGSGKVVFSLDKGRILTSEMDLDLGGNLSIEIAGMTTEVELTQTQKSALKTSDSDPLKK